MLNALSVRDSCFSIAIRICPALCRQFRSVLTYQGSSDHFRLDLTQEQAAELCGLLLGGGRERWNPARTRRRRTAKK